MTANSKPLDLAQFEGHTPTQWIAAQALDASLQAASKRVGIHTDKARETLAAYLDGQIKMRAKIVRRYADYLQMVSR